MRPAAKGMYILFTFTPQIDKIILLRHPAVKKPEPSDHKRSIEQKMPEKEYIGFLIMLIVWAIASVLKVTDYFLVRSAVKRERASKYPMPGTIVIKSAWYAYVSYYLFFAGLIVPLVSGSVVAPLAYVIFILFAAGALYYAVHSMLWSMTLDEGETFTCKSLRGKVTTYRYADVVRVVYLGKSKRRLDGARFVMKDGTVILVDRTLYGLDTLTRRARAAENTHFIEETALEPIRTLR